MKFYDFKNILDTQKSPSVSRKSSEMLPEGKSALDLQQIDGRLGNKPNQCLFGPTTKAIVWGMQTRAVQGMLDFDFVCRRTEPSVRLKKVISGRNDYNL